MSAKLDPSNWGADDMLRWQNGLNQQLRLQQQQPTDNQMQLQRQMLQLNNGNGVKMDQDHEVGLLTNYWRF